MRKNLIAHIFPLASTGTWRRSVQHLVARMPLFDGQRIVSIAVDEKTANPEEVIEAFGDAEIVYRVVENDPALGEGVSFPLLLSEARQFDGATFYCHSKGASYDTFSPTAHSWADVAFHLCLDYPTALCVSLEHCPFAGPFQRVEKRMSVDWHYSGTFFWFHRFYTDVPLKFLLPLTADRNCVERWPAEQIVAKHAADLGLADCRNLYDPINWRSWITRRFQKEILWNEDRKADREAALTDWLKLPPTAFQPFQVVYEEAKAHA